MSAAAQSAGRGVTPVRPTLEELIALAAKAGQLSLARLKVRAPAPGAHRSRYKARGMEYEESRPYEPGDDLRHMDWRVTARTGRPFTKVFREERERPVLIALDLRGAMRFGTQVAFKGVVAARVAALLAWMVSQQGERVGGLIFDEHGHQELRPRLGRVGVLRFLHAISANPAWDRPTGLSRADELQAALDRIRHVVRPGSLVFLISDFAGIEATGSRALREIALHSDVTLVHLYDPLEAQLPPAGRYRVSGYAGEERTMDTGERSARTSYESRFFRHRRLLEEAAEGPGIFLASCATNESPLESLREHYGR